MIEITDIERDFKLGVCGCLMSFIAFLIIFINHLNGWYYIIFFIIGIFTGIIGLSNLIVFSPIMPKRSKQ